CRLESSQTTRPSHFRHLRSWFCCIRLEPGATLPRAGLLPNATSWIFLLRVPRPGTGTPPRTHLDQGFLCTHLCIRNVRSSANGAAEPVSTDLPLYYLSG